MSRLPQDMQVRIDNNNTTIVTTSETLVLVGPAVRLNRPNARVRVAAYAQVTIGTGGATVTPRIRRGSLVTSPLVNEANAVTVAAGATETVVAIAEDFISDVVSQEYGLTLAVGSATGNSTVLSAGMMIEAL